MTIRLGNDDQKMLGICCESNVYVVAVMNIVSQTIRKNTVEPINLKISTLAAILNALNHESVRFLVVGGVAVNLHGYQRMTADLDLVIQLDPDNLSSALSVFENFGYKPTIPVELDEFKDEKTRSDWIDKKNMTVFQLWSEDYPDTTIDIFVTEPFDFEYEYQNAETVSLDQDLSIKLISITTLIDMKSSADRPRDRDDIEHLKIIMDENNERS